LRQLLKALMEETEKYPQDKDKSLINHLAKTIADTSKVLGDFGMCPPVLSRIKSVISINYFNSERNKDDQEINTLIDNTQNVESGSYLPIDSEVTSIKCNDSQRVF
jgi:hypothetical protein